MKKVLLLLCFSAFAVYTNAQFSHPFQPKKIQDEAKTIRVYIWDRPVTDSLTYQDILPDGMQPVVMFSFSGKNSYYTLPSNKQYREIQAWFDSLPPSDNVVGAEYVISYLERFSWVGRKKRKNIKDPTIKMTVAAFNNSSKYLILSVSPRLVYGIRDPKTGDIMVDVNSGNSEKTEAVPTGKTMPAVISDKTKVKIDETGKGDTPTKKKTKEKPAEKTRNFGGD